MLANTPAGFEIISRNLEGRRSAAEFVQRLYADAKDYLGTRQRVAKRGMDLMRRVAGAVDISGFNLKIAEEDWRQLLDAVLDDLQEHAEDNDVLVVLAWDEFTTFLGDLERNGKAEEAMVLLDMLRAARARCSAVRTVYNGSIGLEEVLDRLRKQGYANRPINDVAREIVPLLAQADAAVLARGLILSFADDSPETARHIAEICEGHPFAIHHVADRLRTRQEVTNIAADIALDRLLDDANDPLDLTHYIDRMETYFDPDAAAVAKSILDLLVRKTMTANQLAAELDCPRDLLTATLAKLRRDLYLDRRGGRFSFKLGFLRRFWKAERGL